MQMRAIRRSSNGMSVIALGFSPSPVLAQGVYNQPVPSDQRAPPGDTDRSGTELVTNDDDWSDAAISWSITDLGNHTLQYENTRSRALICQPSVT
jgi:hypothetical protein